jgi:hypothetical protein
MKIVTRAAWGARAPKSTPTHVSPSARRYYVVHHSGAPVTQSVRAIQDWCMDGRNFSDIDYNHLVRGSTGEIYEGRGWDVVGAHTVGYNTTGVGVCIIGNDQATEAAKSAVRWLYEQYNDRCDRTLLIRGHRQLATTGTDCPGPKNFAWVRGGLLAPAGGTGGGAAVRVLKRGMTGADVKALQKKLGVAADGDFGPQTERAVVAYQKSHGLAADGIAGPKTRAKLGLS